MIQWIFFSTLSGLTIDPLYGIHMRLDDNDKFNGTAFVAFMRPEDFRMALMMGSSSGNRLVNIKNRFRFDLFCVEMY